MEYAVTVNCTVEVSADSEIDATRKAADMFDPSVEKLVLGIALGTGTGISRLELANFQAKIKE